MDWLLVIIGSILVFGILVCTSGFRKWHPYQPILVILWLGSIAASVFTDVNVVAYSLLPISIVCAWVSLKVFFAKKPR